MSATRPLLVMLSLVTKFNNLRTEIWVLF